MSDKTILKFRSVGVTTQTLTKVLLEEKVKHDAWITQLKKDGVKAAIPDDGWVDREKKCLCFTLAYFTGRISKGDVVAIGWPDKYRLVSMTGRTKKRWQWQAPLWWYYEEVE